MILNMLNFFVFNISVKILEIIIAVDFQLLIIFSFMIFLVIVETVLTSLVKCLKFLFLFPIFVFCLFGIFYLM